jgi:hypothetical protein
MGNSHKSPWNDVPPNTIATKCKDIDERMEMVRSAGR